MQWTLTTALAVGVATGAIAGRPGSAQAQIDYRNLDDDRPTLIEDAYPIEHYAFEALAPYRFEAEPRGIDRHLVVPELEYGIAMNSQLGVKLAWAGIHDPQHVDIVDPNGNFREVTNSRSGLAGLTVFGLYNFTTEGPVLPALSLRADIAFPIGELAGDNTRAAIKAIVTRGFGRNRIHINVARGLGKEASLGEGEPLDRWTYGAAIDRTLFRQSVLLIGEVFAAQAVAGAPTAVNASLGARWQWRTNTVLDIGVGRRLKEQPGPDFALTVGLSHAFAVPGLLPRGR